MYSLAYYSDPKIFLPGIEYSLQRISGREKLGARDHEWYSNYAALIDELIANSNKQAIAEGRSYIAGLWGDSERSLEQCFRYNNPY
tara:strand:+ start:537 stop:794 length:258 start_codon:yes stop_codon:yes gene_type:complete